MIVEEHLRKRRTRLECNGPVVVDMDELVYRDAGMEMLKPRSSPKSQSGSRETVLEATAGDE